MEVEIIDIIVLCLGFLKMLLALKYYTKFSLNAYPKPKTKPTV